MVLIPILLCLLLCSHKWSCGFLSVMLCNIHLDIWTLYHNLYACKCSLFLHSYCWCAQRLFLVLCDTDDADSNRLPTSQPLQRSDQMRGMCKQRLSSCHRLIWPQAHWLMMPKHQHKVIISTTGTLNFFTPLLWGRCFSKVDEGETKGGHRVGFGPRTTEAKDFFFLSRLWVKVIPAHPGRIN